MSSPPETATDPASVGRPRPKWENRREAIIDTSARVFAENGYHATGINELCAANDLGKGALYHYIGSKEELLAAIHDQVMDSVLNSGQAVVESDESSAAKLTALGDALLDIIARHPHHVWVFLHEFPALTGERADRFRRRRRAYERLVEQILQAGMDSGDFRPLDARLTALAWLGMHNYTYLWLRPDGTLDAHEVARRFADLFIKGISAT